MNKQGVVSIWFGRIENKASLDLYVDVTYDDDGESVTPRFFTAFGLDVDDTDEDFIEKVVYLENRSDVSDLLRGCSYDEVVIPAVSGKLDAAYNAVVLIYNYEYRGENCSVDSFAFIGAVDYE